MDDSVKKQIDDMDSHMSRTIEHLKLEFQKIRAGKASPDMLSSVMVPYYGTPTPIHQVANISVVDARTLSATPWERNLITTVEKAIRDANLGLNPSSDGESVRIVIPSLTEERRKQLVKQAKEEAEKAKIALRNIRKDSIDHLKQLQKKGVSEDEVKNAEKKVQDIINAYTHKVDTAMKEKEDQIMTV
ncbi:MAG: ribosome recycling factor [Bacteroidia bacterium]|nr:ribosome recycling factor [Bacteroidia bacterium]